jgi:hypothetical protein
MSDNKRFSTDQVSDWAVFYPAEYRMALAVVRFLKRRFLPVQMIERGIDVRSALGTDVGLTV